MLKLIVSLNWKFGIIRWTECVWLEAAKLTCTSPPAMELLHVVFTSETSFEGNARLRMSEQARFCEAELSLMYDVKHCSFLCFVIAQIFFASTPAWWSYSGRPYTICCVNLGKSSLFGNLGHKLSDGILSQVLAFIPTLCRLGELLSTESVTGLHDQGEVYWASLSVMKWDLSTNRVTHTLSHLDLSA